jgi:DNA-binding PucR family transcriptional regulator
MTLDTVILNGSLRQLAAVLPAVGNFLAVTAAPESVLPNVEERLQAMGVSSAWQVLPGLLIGVVSLSTAQDARVIDLLERIATGGVGVSPQYSSVDEIEHALRLARIALRATTEAERVVVFDRAPLTMVAVADPDARRGVVRAVLGGLDGLSEDDRCVLLDTLEAWAAHNRSAAEAAALLYCHPNTVRYRLRRLEERTGRSLSDPRAVAELLVALAAHKHAA